MMLPTKKYQLPSMEMLTCFEAVARHESFTMAADELCLTQSAVSKKVAALESYFGTKLFVRLHRSIHLTDEGRKILQSVRKGLDHLNESLKGYHPQGSDNQLTISTSVSFSYYWLIPRLEKFNEFYPDINVNVISSDKPVNFKKDGSEIAILFGGGDWPDLAAHKLVDEVIHVVASPSYLEKHQVISKDNLEDQILVHLKEGMQTSDGMDWDRWMRQIGTQIAPKKEGPSFNSYPMVLQAVEAGRGLGLGWDYAVADKIELGQLQSVFADPMRTDQGYYLVTKMDNSLSLNARRFKDWIIGEANI